MSELGCIQGTKLTWIKQYFWYDIYITSHTVPQMLPSSHSGDSCQFDRPSVDMNEGNKYNYRDRISVTYDNWDNKLNIW